MILKSFASQIRSNIGCCINNLVSIYKNNAVGVTFEEFITSNFVWVVETIRREVFKNSLNSVIVPFIQHRNQFKRDIHVLHV